MPAAVPAAVPAVLVLRAAALGDLLVVVPALRALRRAFPDRRIVLATPGWLEPVARWSGAVDEVLPVASPADLRWTGPPPSVAVNLHGTGPQSRAALDRTGPDRRIGVGWTGPALLPTHERERWCAVLVAAGIPADPADLALPPPGPSHGAVLVHPGAQYGAKRWPATRWAAVASALHRDGHRVLVTGSAGERSLAVRIAAAAGLPPSAVVAGGTDLPALAALVAGARLLLVGDSGPAHLASAFGTPSVLLFGPVGPERWGPPATGPHTVLTDAAARRGDPFADDPDPALLAVGVDDVLTAAREALSLASRTADTPRRSGTCAAPAAATAARPPAGGTGCRRR